MKQTLVIGSTVVDVHISLPHLPKQGDDINIISSIHRIGGCAYNVYRAIQFSQSPARLCSPVGSGIYGRMVREQLEAEGVQPIVILEQENGCCYCLIEPDGERSFLAHHGAEYYFSRAWMDAIDYSATDSMFICGLEVEEPTGIEIVEYVREHPELELYFAPGPRIMHIPVDRMEQLLCRRDWHGNGPLLHLNEREALLFTGKDRVQESAEALAQWTKGRVVVTLGERGCYCLEEPGAMGTFVPSVAVTAVNTVGAGDAHCGTLIACLKKGMNLEAACAEANRIGAAIASQ